MWRKKGNEVSIMTLTAPGADVAQRGEANPLKLPSYTQIGHACDGCHVIRMQFVEARTARNGHHCQPDGGDNDDDKGDVGKKLQLRLGGIWMAYLSATQRTVDRRVTKMNGRHSTVPRTMRKRGSVRMVGMESENSDIATAHTSPTCWMTLIMTPNRRIKTKSSTTKRHARPPMACACGVLRRRTPLLYLSQLLKVHAADIVRLPAEHVTGKSIGKSDNNDQHGGNEDPCRCKRGSEWQLGATHDCECENDHDTQPDAQLCRNRQILHVKFCITGLCVHRLTFGTLAHLDAFVTTLAVVYAVYALSRSANALGSL